MNIMALLNALPGACAQGLIWGIMAIGVFITYKILDLADLTVDGTMCTGGAVCIMMMMSGHSVWISLLVAFLAGMLAGLVTGILHAYLGIPAILAGILTQLGLYSINLRIMDNKANQAINVDKYPLLVSLQLYQGCSLLPEYAFDRRDHTGASDCHLILVLWHRTGLFHPCHRIQPQYVKSSGHQHRFYQDSGADDQ